MANALDLGSALCTVVSIASYIDYIGAANESLACTLIQIPVNLAE